MDVLSGKSFILKVNGFLKPYSTKLSNELKKLTSEPTQKPPLPYTYLNSHILCPYSQDQTRSNAGPTTDLMPLVMLNSVEKCSTTACCREWAEWGGEEEEGGISGLGERTGK